MTDQVEPDGAVCVGQADRDAREAARRAGEAVQKKDSAPAPGQFGV
jgi:hypothetical protein